MLAAILAALQIWVAAATSATLIEGRCSVCIHTGQRSTVVMGVCGTTLVYAPPFYDENGKLHHHDPNTTVCSFQCSNGHSGADLSHNTCWCGWPKSGPYKGQR